MNSKTAQLIFAISLLLAPGLALAGNMPGPGGASAWTIQAFANGNVIANILMAASAMAKSGVFVHLLEFLAVLGLLGAVIAVGMSGDHPRKIAWVFVMATLFLTAGLHTTTTVDVNDSVTGYNRIIKNVPIIIALPEAVVSTAGEALAQLFGTFFSTVTSNDLTVSGSGAFNIASSLLQASTQIQVTNPGLRATIAAFTKNCIVPSLVSGRLSTSELIASTELWDGSNGTLSGVNPSPLTPVYTDTNPTGVIVPCGAAGVDPSTTATTVSNSNPSVSADNAYDYISDYLHAPGAQNEWLGQATGANWKGTSAFSWLSNTLHSAQDYLLGPSFTQSTGETISQAAAINALSPAMNAAAIASGQSQLVTAMAVAQGEKSQVSSWATAVALFRDLSGYIYSVLQAFLIALTPILIAAAFIPGTGWTMVKSYIHITVWLALWIPVLEVINFIVDLYAQGTFGNVLPGVTGYSMASVATMSKMSSHMVLAAGFLAAMTPLITWALVKGSFAFTEFLANGMGTHLAGLAGSIAATGNISLDNQSFGNTSMNQQMMATTMTNGTDVAKTDLLGNTQAVTTAQFGGDIGQSAAGRFSVTNTASNSAAVAKARTAMQSASSSASVEARQADNSMAQAKRSLNNALSDNTSGGSRLSAGQMADLKATALQGINTALKENVGNKADLQDARNKIVDGKLDAAGLLKSITGVLGGLFGGAGGGFGTAGLGGGIGINSKEGNSLDTQAGTDLSASRQRKTGQGADYGAQSRRMKEASVLFSRLEQATRGVSKAATENLSKAAGLTQQASQNYSVADSARETIQSSSGLNVPTAFDSPGAVSRAYRDALANAGKYSPTGFGQARDAESRLSDRVDQQVDSRGAAVREQATPAAERAEAGGTEAAGRVSHATVNFDRDFSAARQHDAASLGSARAKAQAAADGTSGKAHDKVDAEKKTNKNIGDSVKGQVKATTGAAAKGVASTLGTGMTKPAGDGDNKWADAGAAAAGATAGAVVQGGAKYAVAKALAKKAAAEAGGATEGAEAGGLAFGAGDVGAAALEALPPLALATGVAIGGGYLINKGIDSYRRSEGEVPLSDKPLPPQVQLTGNPATPSSDDLDRRFDAGDE